MTAFFVLFCVIEQIPRTVACKIHGIVFMYVALVEVHV